MTVAALVSVGVLASPALAGAPHWTAVKGTPGGRLTAVSCSSPSSCMAVGGTANGQPMVMRYASHHWKTQAVTFPAGAYVGGVSCASSKACMVVGYGSAGPLAEKWNGSGWSQVTAAAPDSGSGFKAVSCPTARDCWAVGSIDGNAPLAERWTGSQFTVVPTVTVGTLDYLYGVSCTGKFCLAVGGGSKGALLERSSGGAFSRVTAGHTLKGYSATLWAVSCPSSSYCVAVGEQDNTKSGAGKTLTEVYRGRRFSTVSSPDPTHLTPPFNTLLGVSCVSVKDCWAAGYGGAFSYGGPHPTAKYHSTITARWNGKTWKVAHSVNPGNLPSDLIADSCASSAACVAVGQWSGDSSSSLIERLS